MSADRELELWQAIKAKGDERAYRTLFESLYRYLVATAYRYVQDADKAKDFAQDAFVELWNRRETLILDSGVKPYLRRAVVNKCLNYIKRERKMSFKEHAQLPETAESPEIIEQLALADTKRQVVNIIDGLPERCRIIFCLSRFDQKTHREIAEELGITPKTVENQITRALKVLRQFMHDRLDLWWLILLSGDLGDGPLLIVELMTY